MRKIRRGITAVPALAMLLGGTVLAGTAGAQSFGAPPGSGWLGGGPVHLSCGAVITHSTVLANNIGPCQGNGLVVQGNHIQLNLNHHTITGSHQGTPSSTEQVGVLMSNVTGDSVFNGTVQYFDAGVAINSGSGNTVRGITARDNISRDLLVSGGVLSHTNVSPDQMTCNYGDGITTFQSNNNVIDGNTVNHNGPFSGISLVRGSSHNQVTGNLATDNDVVNQTTSGQGTLCGAGELTTNSGSGATGPMASGRPVQDIGIRVEGPNDVGNTVRGNRVLRSALYGISIHSYPCNVLNGMNASANTGNTIAGNYVADTGAATHTLDSTASGIGILRQGPQNRVCVSNGNTIVHNTSVGNYEYGIFLGGPAYVGTPFLGTNATNVVNHNVVDNNHVDGIHLNNGALNNILQFNTGHGNGRFDGADLNPGCDHNHWAHNAFGTVNQPCVASNNGTGTVRQVVPTSATGSSGAKTLSVTFSSPVNVTNPSGFTVYSNSTCSSLVGTGQSVASGDGTMTPVIQLNAAPGVSPRGHPAYYEVAPNSVTTPGGVHNATVPCTAVSFGT